MCSSNIPEVKFIFLIPWVPEHGPLLGECLDAIKKQGFSRAQCKVLLQPDEERRGQVYWLNRMLDGMFEGTVDLRYTYINFHGADDRLLPGRLTGVREFIKNTGFPGWIYGGHLTERKGILRCKNVLLFDMKKLKRKNYIAGGAVFVRADMYLNERFRDLAFGQGADWDMWLRLGKKEKPRVINDYLYIENLDTSVIRPKPSKITTKIFNRVKYPLWRIQRCLKDSI
jgi:hypothetical protein